MFCLVFAEFLFTLVPKPRMAGVSLALPELLQDSDVKSWLRCFAVCAATNEWNAEKQLLRLPTLLHGQTWGIFDSMSTDQTDTYARLKKAFLDN